MKKLLVSAVLLSAGLVLASPTVIFQDDFESYDEGIFLGQGDTVIMTSTVNCKGEEPAPEECCIVSADGNKALHVQKVATPPGVPNPGSDRGVKIPLNWGSIDYANGQAGKITISGKVYVTQSNSYGELRLASETDQPMMRFCFCSSDYQVYCYTGGRNTTINSGAANKEDPRFADASFNNDKIKYSRSNAVVYNTWLDFTLVINTETACLESYDVTDGGSLNFHGETCCHLDYFNQRPAYVEFTAVGNGYDTNRAGYDLDDLVITFESQEEPWVTVFEDNFTTYTVGESLCAQNDAYQRLGDEPTFSDLIVNDSYAGKCAKLWINNPEGYPKDGVYVACPGSTSLGEGGRIKVSTTYYCPDNGTWTKLMHNGDNLAAFGFHSANLWFAAWGSDDSSPRYDDRTPGTSDTWITSVMTVNVGPDGPYLDSIVRTAANKASRKWGTKWSSFADTSLAAVPSEVGLQVQGWNAFDGRYMLLSNVKVEMIVPEPALFGLLALCGLFFARRRS